MCRHGSPVRAGGLGGLGVHVAPPSSAVRPPEMFWRLVKGLGDTRGRTTRGRGVMFVVVVTVGPHSDHESKGVESP